MGKLISSIFGKKSTPRDYYDRTRTSYWNTSTPVYYRFSVDVDDRLKRLYLLALKEWEPTLKKCGVNLVEGEPGSMPHVILRGWTNFTNNAFGWTEIHDSTIHPRERSECNIALNTARRDRSDEEIYAVLLHELGHAFAYNSDETASISPNKEDIMCSPTYARTLSDADRRTLERVYSEKGA